MQTFILKEIICSTETEKAWCEDLISKAILPAAFILGEFQNVLQEFFYLCSSIKQFSRKSNKYARK